ncbi:hypothetical protein [Streptomyces sp. NPDC048527]|uniref:hypothetical protein n=1 Tax=Streptomyces sp. NPDC048527 TaxID=3365568 RepID=UPI0037230382
MSWQLGLEYLRVLVWPSVVVTLGILLRRQLRGMVRRVQSVETPVGTVSFDAAADQALDIVREPGVTLPAAEFEWPNFASLRRKAPKRRLPGLETAFHQGSVFIQQVKGELGSIEGSEQRILELEQRRGALAQELRRLADNWGGVGALHMGLYIDEIESTCHEALISLRSAQRALPAASDATRAALEPPAASES